MTATHLLVKSDGVIDGLLPEVLQACRAEGLQANVLGLVQLTWADIRAWGPFVQHLPDREQVLDYLSGPGILVEVVGDDALAQAARVKRSVRQRHRNERLRNVLHTPDDEQASVRERQIFNRRLLAGQHASTAPGITVSRAEGRTVAAVQPCFFPWPGQLAMAARADLFVFLDTAMWASGRRYARNEIDAGTTLTVPLRSGRSRLRLNEVRTRPWEEWVPSHEKTLDLVYGRRRVSGMAPVDVYREAMRGVDIDGEGTSSLTAVTMRSTRVLADRLMVDTPLLCASAIGVDFAGPPDATGKLVELCIRLGATRYLSGPLARSYLNPSGFANAGVTLEFVEYTPYAYRGDQGPVSFSALDLIARRSDAAELLEHWLAPSDLVEGA